MGRGLSLSGPCRPRARVKRTCSYLLALGASSPPHTLKSPRPCGPWAVPDRLPSAPAALPPWSRPPQRLPPARTLSAQSAAPQRYFPHSLRWPAPDATTSALGASVAASADRSAGSAAAQGARFSHSGDRHPDPLLCRGSTSRGSGSDSVVREAPPTCGTPPAVSARPVSPRLPALSYLSLPQRKVSQCLHPPQTCHQKMHKIRGFQEKKRTVHICMSCCIR